MTDDSTGPLRVALLGCGVVGSQVARLLTSNGDDLRARSGRPLELIGIGVRRQVPRPGLDPALFTTDLEGLVRTPGVDLVIELIGGVDPAFSLIKAALANRASVVTANKALLAERGAELFADAERCGVDLYYEAAVAGAIPIIRPLGESLVGDDVTAVMGIVNGTTNFILDKMNTQGETFEDALAEAQALGFAEADPTADVDGYDAAAKAALLAGLAFHTTVDLADVAREGIRDLTLADMRAAQDLRHVVKLIARCSLSPDGTIAVGVHPTMVPASHPLAGVSGAYNAVFVESRNAGRLMFMGPGAGGSPTASAVLGDVVTAARNRVRGVSGPGRSTYTQRRATEPGAVVSKFFVALLVADRTGVLARVAEAFARHGVSLEAVRQDATEGSEHTATLGVLTHAAPRAAIRATLHDLAEMTDVLPGTRVLRVLEE